MLIALSFLFSHFPAAKVINPQLHQVTPNGYFLLKRVWDPLAWACSVGSGRKCFHYVPFPRSLSIPVTWVWQFNCLIRVSLLSLKFMRLHELFIDPREIRVVSSVWELEIKSMQLPWETVTSDSCFLCAQHNGMSLPCENQADPRPESASLSSGR